ncbi:hypothetical protein JCM8097_002297 [Rhodosporidiobolus ruineniae]
MSAVHIVRPGSPPFIRQHHDPNVKRMRAVYHYTHLPGGIVLPWGEPGEPPRFVNPPTFRRWNSSFERFLSMAYDPSSTVWMADDTCLALYLDDWWIQFRNVIRGECVLQSARISTSIQLDGFLGRWRALSQQRREELLVKRFEEDALSATSAGMPYGRLYTPELTLSNLLRGDGEGFVELAMSCCWPLGRSRRDADEQKIPTVRHGVWEKLVGVPAEGVAGSRFRRAYVETMYLVRHQALFRVIDRIQAELHQPGDLTPQPLEAVLSKEPQCGFCGDPIMAKKPLRCSRCLEKANRSTWYCSAEHQKNHWLIGHKRICGKKDDEIPLETSFSTSPSSPPTGLEAIRATLLRRQDSFWIFRLRGMRLSAVPRPDMFPPGGFEQALADLRQLAFDTIDKPELLGITTLALMLRAYMGHLLGDRAEAAWPEQLHFFAEDFELGKDGPKIVAEGIVEVVTDFASKPPTEQPGVRHFLEFLLPGSMQEEQEEQADQPPDNPCPSRGLSITRSVILRHPHAVWAYPLSDDSEHLAAFTLSSFFFPSDKLDEALAQFRQVALQACEKPEPFSMGVSALAVGKMAGLVASPAWWRAEMRLMAEDFQLEGEGAAEPAGGRQGGEAQSGDEQDDPQEAGANGGAVSAEGKDTGEEDGEEEDEAEEDTPGVTALKAHMEFALQALDGEEGDLYPWIKFFLKEWQPEDREKQSTPEEVPAEQMSDEAIDELAAALTQVELKWPPLRSS